MSRVEAVAKIGTEEAVEVTAPLRHLPDRDPDHMGREATG